VLTFLALFASLILILFNAVLLLAIWNTSLCQISNIRILTWENDKCKPGAGNYFADFGYSISKGGITMLRLIIRFIVSALVLMFVGFLVPGFGPLSFVNALIAAVVISVLGYAIEALFGKNLSPQGRGIIGFLTSAVVIYLSQFIVRDLDVTILGALAAALIIGIIDIFVPTELR
jgi:uncharacterized membrane protein YvlD (DUF360 family)